MPKRYTPNDLWSRKAAAEGYRARSVYKLKELDEKFGLLAPGMTVLDLGAAPGSWLQYVHERIGPKGLAIGVDLQPIKPIAKNVVTFVQDMTDQEKLLANLGEKAGEAEEGISFPASPAFQVDLILSDAAPSTSGIHDVDQWKSIELVTSALAVAKRILKPGGRVVMKVFRGADFDAFLRDMKREWDKVQSTKSNVSRDRSTEIYVIATMRN